MKNGISEGKGGVGRWADRGERLQLPEQAEAVNLPPERGSVPPNPMHRKSNRKKPPLSGGNFGFVSDSSVSSRIPGADAAPGTATNPRLNLTPFTAAVFPSVSGVSG